MRDNCPDSGPLLDGIEIEHGPSYLLRRFFACADGAAKARGVSLFFARLEDLVAENKANSDTWRPLVPIFSPELGGVTPQTGFVILGRDSSGDVVAAQAARLYDWDESNLYDEGVSLRMFYADPEAAFARGDSCEVTTPVARSISGKVVFSGAGWYRPDYRGKDLATIIPRISRAYAFTHWNSDFTISMIGDAVIAGGMAERCGYTQVESSAVDLVVSPLGALRCALVWMDSRQLLSDLDAVSGDDRQSGDYDEAFVKDLFSCVDNSDWSGLQRHLHDDIVYERPGYEPLVGKAAVLKFYRQTRIVASGKHVVERVLSDGSNVACWGNFYGKAKDGRELRAGFVDVYRLKEGRIGFRRTYFDSPAM